MSSHPGTESLRDIISLFISLDVTGDKNIVSEYNICDAIVHEG